MPSWAQDPEFYRCACGADLVYLCQVPEGMEFAVHPGQPEQPYSIGADTWLRSRPMPIRPRMTKRDGNHQMHPEVAELVRLMPPPVGDPGPAIDWARAEQAWEMVFPSDYKDFVNVYGKGSFVAESVGSFFGVVVPECSPEGETVGSMREETAIAQEDWDEGYGDKPEDLPPGADRMVTWAVDASADLLCWLVTGPDPDVWPVAVYNRTWDKWSLHDVGMAGFLRKMLAGEFEELPLSLGSGELDSVPTFIRYED
ncbi:SMI1/KNR4 family protein [Streptomyces sp. NPDC005131]